MGKSTSAIAFFSSHRSLLSTPQSERNRIQSPPHHKFLSRDLFLLLWMFIDKSITSWQEGHDKKKAGVPRGLPIHSAASRTTKTITKIWGPFSPSNCSLYFLIDFEIYSHAQKALLETYSSIVFSRLPEYSQSCTLMAKSLSLPTLMPRKFSCGDEGRCVPDTRVEVGTEVWTLLCD